MYNTKGINRQERNIGSRTHKTSCVIAGLYCRRANLSQSCEAEMS